MDLTLPPRDRRGHKGTFGTVLVLGGHAAGPRVMLGAPCLAATAALRVGAGLGVLAVPAPLASAALAIRPEATALALPVDEAGRLDPSGTAQVLDAHAGRPSCLVVGPGLGVGPEIQQIVIRLVAREDGPIVLDADALNALAAAPDFARDMRAPVVITPHPGEYDRLARALGLDGDARGDGRPEAASTLAQRLGCVVVLKGPGTVVTDGQRTWIDDEAGAVLATGGTGDVLAGIVGGLVATHHGASPFGLAPPPGTRDLFTLACVAVRAHTRSGRAWAERHEVDRDAAGLLAGDLTDELPRVVASLRASDH